MYQILRLKIKKSIKIISNSWVNNLKLLLVGKREELEDVFQKLFKGNLCLKSSLLDLVKARFLLENYLEVSLQPNKICQITKTNPQIESLNFSILMR